MSRFVLRLVSISAKQSTGGQARAAMREATYLVLTNNWIQVHLERWHLLQSSRQLKLPHLVQPRSQLQRLRSQLKPAQVRICAGMGLRKEEWACTLHSA